MSIPEVEIQSLKKIENVTPQVISLNYFQKEISKMQSDTDKKIKNISEELDKYKSRINKLITHINSMNERMASVNDISVI